MEDKETLEVQEQNYPKFYWLFSVTMVVDGKRKFVDIPVYSHRLVFPNRTLIYKFACDHIGCNPENNDIYKSFSVINIYKFESQEDYESFVLSNDEPESLEKIEDDGEE